MTKRDDLLSIYRANTGTTLHIPKETGNTLKLTSYFRDRADQSTVSDIRRVEVMICPHCHESITPARFGQPIDPKLSRAAKRPIRYQRYRCPVCFRCIKGDALK